MKDPSKLCDDTNLRNEEFWESEHVIDSTQRTCSILDANYQRVYLSIIVSNNKHSNNNEQSILCDVLNKYEFLFDGNLGN